ncbi:hypothetical protein QJS10_CPA06g00181 [Acorus calamus]|uniref:Uncharacterized protein n=1 Tax=Acorus calamus TaxID=4465 RepID=A0AAV9ES22_ACOCL|nr:hypothetical protein QJS10_CPA06g00181 [Acorus calamus]
MLFKDFSLITKGLWSVPLYLPGTAFYRAMRARARIVGCFSKLIGERKREMEDGKIIGSQHNMISSLLSLRDEDGRRLTEDEIIDNLVGLTIASHDTTTSLLTSFIRILARDAFIYEQVYKEHAKVVSEKEEKYLTWKDIQKMKYTWRVAKELLRMYSPVFGNFRKVVKDTSFNGFDIPKGWQVEWTTTSHMDGRIFKDPKKFDPSRFEASRTYPPYTYVPFGAGQRMCPGSEFSKVEVLLIVHHFVLNYRFSEMIPDEPLTRIPVTSPALGLPIKLEKIE